MITIKEASLFCKDGDWIESKDQSPSGIRLIQTGNIGIGTYLDKFNRAKYISEETFDRMECTEVFPGDIIISRLPAPVGRACIVPDGLGRSIAAVDCTILRIDEKKFLKEYILLYSETEQYKAQIEKFLAGSTRVRISRKNLESISIPQKNLETQKSIVSRIYKIKNIIDLREQQLSKLDQLVKSRFIEMFGDPASNPYRWELATVEDVCSSIVRGPFGSALKKEFFVKPDKTTYKVYEQKNAIQKSATIGTYYINKEKYYELRRFECFPGDILMSCSGTMGELYQLPPTSEKGIINQALCKFTLNNKILPVFFLAYMKETIGNLEVKGSGIQNIAAVSYVKAMPINLPPISVQKQFATFCAQVDKSKLPVKQSLETLETLKKSLMQEYFG